MLGNYRTVKTHDKIKSPLIVHCVQSRTATLNVLNMGHSFDKSTYHLLSPQDDMAKQACALTVCCRLSGHHFVSCYNPPTPTTFFVIWDQATTILGREVVPGELIWPLYGF